MREQKVVLWKCFKAVKKPRAKNGPPTSLGARGSMERMGRDEKNKKSPADGTGETHGDQEIGRVTKNGARPGSSFRAIGVSLLGGLISSE
jgi:hypothetical protein